MALENEALEMKSAESVPVAKAWDSADYFCCKEELMM